MKIKITKILLLLKETASKSRTVTAHEIFNRNTTPNKFIKSGYWKIDDISQFLQLSPRDREIYLLDSMLPKPLSPEAYAAEVSVNPEMVKKYVFYAACDTNNENYYRYLVHVKSANLVDNWEYRDRKYVIYYEFS